MPYQSGFRSGFFADESIVVTGGGSGLGRCIAHELAALGARVSLVGRTREKLERVRDEILADGGRAGLFTCDIRDEEAVTAVVAQILEAGGRIHGLVNNAGGQFPAQLRDLSLNGWNAVVANNMTGTFLFSREVFRQSMEAHGGAIVNVGADHELGMPGMGHNGAARAGQANFTLTASVEWAHAGVRVNHVIPGFIASSGLDAYPASAADTPPPCEDEHPPQASRNRSRGLGRRGLPALADGRVRDRCGPARGRRPAQQRQRLLPRPRPRSVAPLGGLPSPRAPGRIAGENLGRADVMGLAASIGSATANAGKAT